MTPRVYVVQEARKLNVRQAGEYGDVHFLLPHDLQIMFGSQPAVARMRAALREYRPEDYVLPIGDPVAIGTACALAADATGGRFQVLKWDRRDQRYYPVTINLSRSEQPGSEEGVAA